MMRALYKAPSWFTRQQKRLYLQMNDHDGHEQAMRQNDDLGFAYRRGYAYQNLREDAYERRSLAYAAYRAGCDYGLATRSMVTQP